MSFGFDCCCCCECKQYLLNAAIINISSNIYIKPGNYLVANRLGVIPSNILQALNLKQSDLCVWTWSGNGINAGQNYPVSLQLAHDLNRNKWYLFAWTQDPLNPNNVIYNYDSTQFVNCTDIFFSTLTTTASCYDCCGFPQSNWPPSTAILNISGYGIASCICQNGGTVQIDYSPLNGQYICSLDLVNNGAYGWIATTTKNLIFKAIDCINFIPPNFTGNIKVNVLAQVGLVKSSVDNCTCSIGGSFLYFINGGGNGGVVSNGSLIPDCSALPLSFQSPSIDIVSCGGPFGAGDYSHQTITIAGSVG